MRPSCAAEANRIADAVADMDPAVMDARERYHYEALSWHIKKYLEPGQ